MYTRTQDPSARSLRVHRGSGRLALATAVAATAILGLQQPAHAAAVPAPPAGASAAPSSVSVIAGANSGFWASDSCHYFEQVGWQSDLCARQLVDRSGRVLSKIGLFQNIGNGAVGREMIRIDYSDSAYLVSGFLALPAGPRWIRTSRSDGRMEEAVHDAATGSWTWRTVAPAPGPVQTTYPNAGQNAAVAAGLRADFNRILQDNMSRMLAPTCNSSFNGCR